MRALHVSVFGRPLASIFLILFILCGCGVPNNAVAADDPPADFSKRVTALSGDWEAQDWRRGVIKLHPNKFTWQSDMYLELLPEESISGRTPQNMIEAYFAGTEVDDNKVDMRGAKDIAPGIMARSFRWEYAFDNNLGFWGVITTKANTYVGFSAACEFNHPDKYQGELCLRKILELMLQVQSGNLKMPEPKTPLSVPGWEGEYLTDGTSVLTNKNYNGLRVATIYASPPSSVAQAELSPSIVRFAANTVDADDGAPTAPQWSGSPANPLLVRLFPKAFEGPSIQMAGGVKISDGRTVMLSARCPNQGWIASCTKGMQLAIQALGTGAVEQRRQKLIAVTNAPPPANGLKNSQIVGLYTQGRTVMGAGGFMTGFQIEGYLYLRDGTVTRDFDKPPAYIDPATSRTKEPANWGRWRQSGRSISIVWGDGDTDTVDVKGDNLMIGGPSGMRLNGKYRYVSGGGTQAFGGGSSFFSERSYQFYPDGTFTSDRSSSFIAGPGPGGGDGATAIGGSQGAGTRGRYVIDGFTIKLTYPDGRITRLSFAAYAHEIGKPLRGGVMLNGSYYFRDTP